MTTNGESSHIKNKECLVITKCLAETAWAAPHLIVQDDPAVVEGFVLRHLVQGVNGQPRLSVLRPVAVGVGATAGVSVAQRVGGELQGLRGEVDEGLRLQHVQGYAAVWVLHHSCNKRYITIRVESQRTYSTFTHKPIKKCLINITGSARYILPQYLL